MAPRSACSAGGGAIGSAGVRNGRGGGGGDPGGELTSWTRKTYSMEGNACRTTTAVVQPSALAQAALGCDHSYLFATRLSAQCPMSLSGNRASRHLSAETVSDRALTSVFTAISPKIVEYWKLFREKQGQARSVHKPIQAILLSCPQKIWYRPFSLFLELLRWTA